MKRLYFLTFAVLCGSAGINAVSPTVISPLHVSRNASRFEAKTPALWRAATQELYVWYDGEWMLDEINSLKYNDKGLLIENVTGDGESTYFTRTSYTYNDAGYFSTRLIELTDNGTDYKNSERTERRFDSVVNTFVTATYAFNWTKNSWAQTGNNWERGVTRDADGNVTEVERRVLYMGVFDPTQRMTITYGPDGNADCIVVEDLVANNEDLVWQVSETYSEIVWNRTDGQILSTEDLMWGTNRIASARMTAEDLDVTMSVTYTDEAGSYTAVAKGIVDDMEMESTVEFTVIDQYGSYNQIETTAVELDGERYESTITMLYRTNEFGLDMLIYVLESFDDMDEVLESSQGQLEYDTEGRPIRYIMHVYDPDTGKTEPSIRIDFSNYIDAAGIDDIALDNSDAPAAQLYDMRGMPVSSAPMPGIYIMRQGSTTQKIIIR